jgi:ribonucleoside-diphosphate reductase alpha chain
MRNNGSRLDIPQDLKRLVQNSLGNVDERYIDMSRHRGYFVDQSQSLNLFMQNANYSKPSMHFYVAVWIENWNVLLEQSGS